MSLVYCKNHRILIINDYSMIVDELGDCKALVTTTYHNAPLITNEDGEYMMNYKHDEYRIHIIYLWEPGMQRIKSKLLNTYPVKTKIEFVPVRPYGNDYNCEIKLSHSNNDIVHYYYVVLVYDGFAITYCNVSRNNKFYNSLTTFDKWIPEPIHYKCHMYVKMYGRAVFIRDKKLNRFRHVYRNNALNIELRQTGKRYNFNMDNLVCANMSYYIVKCGDRYMEFHKNSAIELKYEQYDNVILFHLNDLNNYLVTDGTHVLILNRDDTLSESIYDHIKNIYLRTDHAYIETTDDKVYFCVHDRQYECEFDEYTTHPICNVKSARKI